MMKTVTLDILNDKAMNLLKDLELLKLIRLRRENTPQISRKNNQLSKYKGAMTSQKREDIDRQLQELRN